MYVCVCIYVCACVGAYAHVCVLCVCVYMCVTVCVLQEAADEGQETMPTHTCTSVSSNYSAFITLL